MSNPALTPRCGTGKLYIQVDELERSRNGIRHMNIRRFLLEQSWA